MTDIGFRTRCFRKSKRHDLLQGQWEDKRLAAHRQRIQNVAPRIDNDIPLSDSFMHVKVVCTNAHHHHNTPVTFFNSFGKHKGHSLRLTLD